MPESEILTRLNVLFRDLIDDNTVTLTPETTASDVEGWDSVSHVSLIVAIESEFDCKIRTDEMEALKNVGDMVSLIKRKTGA